MTLVRRPSPFGELLSLRQAMDRLFDDSFVGGRPWNQHDATAMPLDIRQTADALIVDAALPGIRPEDVDITVEDGTLTIQASTASEQEAPDGDIVVAEIRRGSMRRVVSLPIGLEPDKAAATFEDGMLHLRIPRAEAVKPRQIRISPTIDGQTPKGSEA